jgi:hypothetical protein
LQVLAGNAYVLSGLVLLVILGFTALLSSAPGAVARQPAPAAGADLAGSR